MVEEVVPPLGKANRGIFERNLIWAGLIMLLTTPYTCNLSLPWWLARRAPWEIDWTFGGANITGARQGLKPEVRVPGGRLVDVSPPFLGR